jgi:predicted RNase H-like nuclease
MHLAGVDGCRGGWLCVTEHDQELAAVVTPNLATWLAATRPDIVVIDMPIGLPSSGPRTCDRLARCVLGRTRAASIFSAPVRAALGYPSYDETCAAHRAVDGRAISKQAWFIVPKIAEVDSLLQAEPVWRNVLHEGHPELSFAMWNGGMPMRHAKRTAAGAAERLALVDSVWPGAALRLARALPKGGSTADDLLDAFAVLWTARRISTSLAVRVPESPPTDATGLPMVITA